MKYGANSISWEQGADKYRRNPARFLGSDDILGIRNQFVEILDNSIDESIRYYRENKLIAPLDINITITNDEEVTVEDFGQGIPCEIHPKYGVPAIYPICESDSAGGKSRGTEGYTGVQTAGVHGAGLAVSLACTEYAILDVDSVSANGKYLLKYKKGIRDGELTRIGDLHHKTKEESSIIGVTEQENPWSYMKGGTKITYKYDESVFHKTLNGRKVEEVFSKDGIVDKLINSLMGSKGEFRVNLKYKDEPLQVLTYEDAKPELIFNNQGSICKINVYHENEPQFSSDIYLKFEPNLYKNKRKTLVNRLDILKSTSTNILLSSISGVVSDYMNIVKEKNKKYQNIKINQKSIEQSVSSVEILSLTGATFDGQTKQRLVSTHFLVDYEVLLTKAFKESKQFFDYIINPIITNEISVYEDKIQLEALKEKQRKKAEKDKLARKSQEEVNKLLENKTLRAQNKLVSKITIKDSPFRLEDSTLVYVEGESAGSVFNNLHDEGEVPVAIALTKGNMPNVTNQDAMDVPLTKDNRVYCLNAGYKDIGILTDADSDGLHIKILHIMQILKFAKNYLDQGRVYLIPSPYSKVVLRQPMTLELYGETKIYLVGETYCYSAKEHQSLVSAGAVVKKKFTGLADSDLSPVYLVKHRENWIKLKDITEEDIKALHIVLSEETLNFRKNYTSDIFSDRQYKEKYIFSNRNTINLDTSDYYRLSNPDNLTDKVDFEGYQDFITDNVIEKVFALRKKE